MGNGHLIGAYGMFWKREEVNWRPGSGPTAWQLLGYRGTNRPRLRLCDFRRAAGFYILWSDFRAQYVGLARGNEGLGARLRTHNDRKAEWSRFSWFAFDDVVDVDGSPGWACPDIRNAIADSTSETVVRECEALLITALGTYTGSGQNRMRFIRGKEWKQVTTQDYAPGGICRRVDESRFTDRSIFREWD